MNENWKTKSLLIGAVVGAVVGVLGALILIQAADKANTRPQISAGDGVKVGLGVLAVMRLLSDLGTQLTTLLQAAECPPGAGYLIDLLFYMTDSIPHIRFLIAGKLSRNYTILASGEVLEDVIGGSAPYGGAGAGLWETGIGLVARASCDFPEQWLNQMARWGLDNRGVRRLLDPVDQRVFTAYPDPETRRTDNPVALFAQMGLSFPKSLLGMNQTQPSLDSRSRPGLLTIRQSDLPSDYLDAIAAHICPLDYLSHTLLPPTLRQGHINTITLDPGEGYMDPTFLDDMPIILSGLTAFLSNEEKLAKLFMGRSTDPWEMAEAIAEMGCDLVVVKRGAAGQYLYNRSAKTKWIIPAYPTKVRSLLGAGDAFCGGFLTGYRATYDPLQAALCGNISASFVIEGSSPFYALGAMPGLAGARLDAIKDKVRRA